MQLTGINMLQAKKSMEQPLETAAAGQPAWLDLIRRQVGSLRYGAVQIVVHDGRVTQIETTERLRFERSFGGEEI
jgi:hypothetical protein